MENRSILISGVGIAGPTLAFWLVRAGFEPVLIEQAPRLREAGYVIDFWGLGYDIAERMGLSAEIDRVGYHMREMRIVDGRGARVAGFGTRVFRELTGGRFVTLGRSDLSRLLFETVKDKAEVVFGDEIVGVEQRETHVEIKFRHAAPRSFDLVIGADGLHSAVRRIAFGAQETFEKPLGLGVAALVAPFYRPRDEEVYMIYGEPGRMLARFALRDDRTLFLFVFAVDAAAWPQRDLREQQAMLRKLYGAGQWESRRALDELERTEELYFDRVSQIRMERWSKDRVALVGDAAFCPSLMAGQGSALAMTAAYVLAGEIARAGGRRDDAFARYEDLLRPYMAMKQRGAARFAAAFAPKTRLELFLRNCAVRASSVPGVAKLLFGRDIVDALRLPDYDFAAAS